MPRTDVTDGPASRTEKDFWREHTSISLQPVAAPSILGLYGFAVSTLMVGANLAGWYGNETTTPLVLLPFAFAFGGVAQLLAAMWSYRARDGLATGIHGAWGSYWIGYGIYYLMVALGAVPGTGGNDDARVAFGWWLVGLAALTWVGVIAALAENICIALVLLALAAGATVLAIGMTADISSLITFGGVILVASAVLAWYAASALMLQSTTRRVVLPMGVRGKPNTPGAIPTQTSQCELGEPGVKVGQ